MKLKQLILLGFLISTAILKAQTDFRPGYIIMTTGDTLYGEIDYRRDVLMSSICKFRSDDYAVKEYSPDDLIEYRFTDSKFYISKELSNKKVFLEYLINGKVNIYYLRDDKGDHYYIDKEDMKFMEIPYDEGIKYTDGKKVFYESTRHIGLLNLYMQDAPKIQSRINAIKKPEHQNLIKLAEDYHNAVCEDEDCIIYEKTLLIKIFPEFLGGIAKFSNVEGLSDKPYAQFGIVGHIRMPRVSEKIYFRTGLLFSQLDFEGDKSNFYKIPCHLEYIYPKGIFRPRIAYGLNFYFPYYRSVSLNLGGNFKLTEKLFLSATSDIEFDTTILLFPNEFLLYCLTLGIFMEL